MIKAIGFEGMAQMARSKGRGPTLAKDINRKLVYNHLKERRQTTRAEMARELQLHKNTVNAIVDELAEAGYTRDLGRQTTAGAGRRPTLVQFHAANKWAVGVQVTSTIIHWAVTDLYARPLESFSRPLESVEPRQVAAELAQGIARLYDTYPKAACIGVCLGIPGLIGMNPGHAIRSSHLGWIDVPLYEMLRADDAIGADIPLHIDNSVKLATLGERWHGGGRELTDFVYCYFGNGIGCGSIVGGGIVRGDDNAAGELGHFVIEPNGPPCGCGNRGCLEALVSLPAISRKISEALSAAPGAALSTDELLSALAGKDERVAAIVEQTGMYIGRALSYVANLLNPSLIICDGPLMQIYARLLPFMLQELRQRSVPSVGARIALAQSQLYPYASCIGAAANVIGIWEQEQEPLT